MSLVDHARRELELCGQFEEDPAFATAIVATIAAFTSYRHGGGSASVAIWQLERLLRHGTLSALTDDPDDWNEVGTGMWQSRRCSAAFSSDGGKTFWLVESDGSTGPLLPDVAPQRVDGRDVWPADPAPPKPTPAEAEPVNPSESGL